MMIFRTIFLVGIVLSLGLTARADTPVRSASTEVTKRTTAPSPEIRKQKLQEILSRKEFSGSRQSFLAKIGQAIMQAIGDAWEWLTSHLGFDIGGVPKGVSSVVSIGIIVLFLMLLAYVLSRIHMKRAGERIKAEAEILYAGPSSPDKALDEAARLAGAGDYRSALRLVYLAVLLHLDEREVIRFDRTGTNWEYFKALRDHRHLQEVIRPVTISFDRKWYGHEAATERDYRAFVEAYRAVEASKVAV